LTVPIYLAHLNPVTNSHVKIINELKKESKVHVLPVIFLKNDQEVNSKSFPFNYEIRKKMLESVFDDSIIISQNYTFHAPFVKYFPPLLSLPSWILRKRILRGIDDSYFTYTGDKAEGYMLKMYHLNPKIGERKQISATSVKTKLYETAQGRKVDWHDDVPEQVTKIINENWEVITKFSNQEDQTTKILGMKFPKEGFWPK